jgi:plastocyanin
MYRFFTALVFFSSTTVLANDPVVVGQKDKAFTVSEVSIKVGDTVRFVNEDSFFHNVFSLSDAALFDLGSFPQGDHRDIQFDTAGEVEVECAIHPSMRMVIHVEEPEG